MIEAIYKKGVVIKNKKSKSISSSIKNAFKKKEFIFYLIPSFTLFGLFVFYPFLKTIYLSMSTTNLKGQVVSFVGLDNFREIFTSQEFLNSIQVTLKFVFLVTIPSICIGLILALLANNRLKGNRIYELIFSLPMAIASAPAAIIWMMIFHPTNGILNFALNTQIGWLTETKYALYSVALVTIWLNLGINFIFILTGLRNIPEELMESAAIDGAGYLIKLRKIILPMISPQMFFVIFMNLIGAFQTFGQIKLLTQGGPGNSTNVLVHSIYREAFFNGRFEMASAQSLILFAIMLCVTILQFRYERKGVHYQ